MAEFALAKTKCRIETQIIYSWDDSQPRTLPWYPIAIKAVWSSLEQSLLHALWWVTRWTRYEGWFWMMIFSSRKHIWKPFAARVLATRVTSQTSKWINYWSMQKYLVHLSNQNMQLSFSGIQCFTLADICNFTARISLGTRFSSRTTENVCAWLGISVPLGRVS